MLTLIRRTLSRLRVVAITVIVLLALFQLALVAVAASLDETHGFDRLASLAPAFIQNGLGMVLTSFGGMAAFGFFEPLIIMLVVEFTIFVGTEPAGDVESGIVDLVLARPLPRHRLITRSLVVMTGTALTLPLVMALSMWANLWWLSPSGSTWPARHTVVLLVAHLAAVAWCFGGAALAAAAWVRRRGAAQALVGVGAVALYLLEVVGEAWPSRALWASRVSPFHRFHGASLLAGQTNPVSDLSTLLGVGAIGIAVAYWQFERRDV